MGHELPQAPARCLPRPLEVGPAGEPLRFLQDPLEVGPQRRFRCATRALARVPAQERALLARECFTGRRLVGKRSPDLAFTHGSSSPLGAAGPALGAVFSALVRAPDADGPSRYWVKLRSARRFLRP